MQVHNFESSSKARLNQILHTLQHVHGIQINFNLKDPKASQSLLEVQKTYEVLRDKLIKESAFNSYLQNSEYTKSILILEAVKLMLTEIAPKRRRKTKVAEAKVDSSKGRTMPAPSTFADQLSDIAAKVPVADENGNAFSNALSSISDKLRFKEELDDTDKEILSWMRSLPKPVSVSQLIKDGVAKFGAMLVDIRKDEIKKYKKVDTQIASKFDQDKQSGKPLGENMKEGKKIDQDGDGDKDFADVMIARMVAGGMSKAAAIAKVKHKSYNKESAANIKETMDAENIVAINAPQTSADSHAHHYEYQASMARSELYRNAKYAMSMMKQVDPHGEVPPWIAGALTKAANYLDKIYHYLDYYKKFEPEKLPEQMDGDMELGETSGGVTRQNLMLIMEYSIKLFEMIKPGDKLEGWVAMKLTTASECVSSCKHYLDYVQFEQHGLDDHFADARRMKSLKESVNLREQEDLAKASTILAAKDMSSQVQSVAEDVAKMSVEDLMPLVDIMRGQFGSDAATAFNQVVKEALDALLDQATKTKETMDEAIDTLNKGGVPSQGSDIESAAEPAGEQTPPADEEDAADLAADIGKLTAGEPAAPEPLGRAKKEELAEKWDAKMHTAKKDIGKWDGYTLAELKAKKSKLMKKEKRTAAEQKTVQQLTFAIRAKQKNKWGKVSESTEGNAAITEKAPPGAKAERFIRQNKEAFLKRHGDRGLEYLYATAWKKFGPKNEDYDSALKELESSKNELKSLHSEFTEHKKEFAVQLSEQKVSDPLNVGYGLIGTNILHRIKLTETRIKNLKEKLNMIVIEGAIGMLHTVHAINKINDIKQIKDKTPYGVAYTSKSGKQVTKVFETKEARDYWVSYRSADINNVKKIGPDTFDRIITSTMKGL